jgi:hypothetical protein
LAEDAELGKHHVNLDRHLFNYHQHHPYNYPPRIGMKPELLLRSSTFKSKSPSPIIWGVDF